MRLLVLVMLGGCFVIPDRPAVQPRLSELPGEREKQDAILDRAYADQTPEHLRPKPSAFQRKVETAVATVAVIIGMVASKSANVTVCCAYTLGDEPVKRKQPIVVPRESNELVPWVRLNAQ